MSAYSSLSRVRDLRWIFFSSRAQRRRAGGMKIEDSLPTPSYDYR
jgi:hypothetical protein